MRPSSNLSWRGAALAAFAVASHAFQIQSAPSPDISLSQLGRVAFAGDFDATSLYEYVGQNEDGTSSNGTNYVFGRFPDGSFAKLSQADASISAMCAFQPNSKMAGVIVAGNFTSLGNQQSLAAAMLDPNTLNVTPLSGLNGQINTVLCDGDTAYFGGAFTAGNSTNAITWTTGWTNLPFSGFNGPVHSVAKLPNGNIAYGGSFSGLGSVSAAPMIPNAQTVNIGSANISSYPNTTTHPGLSDPRNIICRTNNDSGNAWLLADEQPGFWRADFGFTFRPTKLRLYNAGVPNYATKTWRYTFYPTSGIANFTFYNHQGQQHCQADCPMPQGNNTFQDFYFVNDIPMMGFRIDISDWYGNGGGLGGIELFQDDIYSFAVQAFNEPACDDVSYGSNSTVKGPWNMAPAGSPGAQYLSAYLQAGTPDDGGDLSVSFIPDLKQSGNYSIQVWTPGCLGDNTCSTRGTVNISGLIAPDQKSLSSSNVSAQLTQNNNYDKYDEVYYGFVNASSDSFKPSITLMSTQGQKEPLDIVAWKVQFVLRQPLDGDGQNGTLNGLFEYNPAITNQTIGTSALDQAGTSLNQGAVISSIAVVNQDVYAAGNFSSSSGFSHIFVLHGGASNATSLPGQGLNNAVQTMYYDGSNTIYLGGNFTSTHDNAAQGLVNAGAYDTQKQAWKPLGAGVNGVVFDIVPMKINISNSQEVDAIAFSGYFTEIQAFASYPAIPVQSIAVWVPSKQNWIQNLPQSAMVAGRLSAAVNAPGVGPIFAGAVDYQSNAANGVTGLSGYTGNFQLENLPIKVNPEVAQTGSMQTKRATTTRSEVVGVTDGLFYNQYGLNITVLGGHFTVNATNGSTLENLVFINGSNNGQVNGLPGNGSSNTAILSFDTMGTDIFAGGTIENGFIQYDLASASTVEPQPPALQGGSGTVQAVASRPSSSIVYFGGDFLRAGSLGCAAFCMYDTGVKQWNVPAPVPMADNSVVNVIVWQSDTQAILAGNMTIGGNRTTLARFDSKAGTYTSFQDAGNPAIVPGPIADLTPTDSSYTSFFVTGVATNGSVFIQKFSNSNNNANPISGSWITAVAPNLLGPATVIESVQTMPVSSSHSSNSLVDSNHILLITGILQMTGVGNVSAATFDGTTLSPFVLSTQQGGGAGTIRAAFVQNPSNLLSQPSQHHIALGLVVLIALALALACVLILSLLIVAWEKYKRRREGYVPAPTSMTGYEKSGNIGDISPEQLFRDVHAGSTNSNERSVFEE